MMFNRCFYCSHLYWDIRSIFQNITITCWDMCYNETLAIRVWWCVMNEISWFSFALCFGVGKENWWHAKKGKYSGPWALDLLNSRQSFQLKGSFVCYLELLQPKWFVYVEYLLHWKCLLVLYSNWPMLYFCN